MTTPQVFYTSNTKINLFNDNSTGTPFGAGVCSLTSGSFENVPGVVIGTNVTRDAQEIPPGGPNSFLFSSNVSALNKTISFTSSTSGNVPPDLNNTNLAQLYKDNKYLIIVNASIVITKSCTDPLSTTPGVRIAVTNSTKQLIPFPQITDLWANEVFLVPTGNLSCNGQELGYSFAGEPWVTYNGTSFDLKEANDNFGSPTGTTIETLQQIKQVGFSFFSSNVAARGCFNAEIEYGIIAYPKNADGSNPIVTPPDSGGGTTKKSSDKKKPDEPGGGTNWVLILGIGGGILLLMLIIIIIIAVI